MGDGSDEQRKDAHGSLVAVGCLNFMAEKIALALIPLEDERPMDPELEAEIIGIQRRFAMEYAEPLFPKPDDPKAKSQMIELTQYANATLATYRDLALMHGDSWYYERYQGGLESVSGPPLTYAEADRAISG